MATAMVVPVLGTDKRAGHGRGSTVTAIFPFSDIHCAKPHTILDRLGFRQKEAAPHNRFPGRLYCTSM